MHHIGTLIKKQRGRVWGAGKIIPYLWRYKAWLYVSSVFLVLSSMIEVIFPLATIELFARIRSGQLTLLSPLVMGLGLLYLVGMLSMFVSNLLIAYTGERAVLDLRMDVYRHLNTLPLGFFIEHQTGELLSRLSSDVSRLQTAVESVFSGLITNTLTIIGISLILVTINPRLAILLPLFLLPFVGVGTLLGLIFHYLSARIQDHLAAAFSLAEDTLHGMKTVRVHNQQAYEIDRFGQSLQASLRSAMRLVYWQSGANAFLTLLGRLAATGILIIVAQSVLNENFSLEETLTFLYYAALLWGALYGWMWVYLSIQNVGGATERIFEILQRTPDVQDRDNAPDLMPIRGHILFEHIAFAYDSRQALLQDFHLEIQAGEMVALVGASGSGKTTILHMLCRFFDPHAGRILIDGIDIGSVTQHSLRAQLGVVFQEPFIFSTSILENIRYANLQASPSDILWAAQSAEVDGFVREMPDGYETIVGENGMRLSGGQRQRIAFARMLLARPKIVLLDEVTSSQDGAAERIMTTTLKRIFKDQTVLLVSHRLSTVQQADRIVVISQGTVAETGTHTELLQKEGIYTHLFGAAVLDIMAGDK
jgi:ATP-binding cassette, subfamily B, bacterial MsbA